MNSWYHAGDMQYSPDLMFYLRYHNYSGFSRHEIFVVFEDCDVPRTSKFLNFLKQINFLNHCLFPVVYCRGVAFEPLPQK